MSEPDHFSLGQFVVFDGLPAVVVGLPGGYGVQTPEDHLALWFGDPRVERASQGGLGDRVPEVWTVPAEYCEACRPPEIRH